jgi:serine phosphatase RsbU (regulator of sigma subunit)
MGNYPKALEYFYEGQTIKEELGDKYGISNYLQSIGNIFSMQEEYSRALNYYQSAREQKEEIEDKSGMCLLLNAMGKVYLQTKNYSRALEYTLESLELARELNLVDAQKDVHKQLSDIYFTLGSYRKAYENHMLYKELYDSIYNVQEITRLAGLELQYMYEKEKQAIELEQLKKDAILAEEAKQQKLFRNSLIIGFILMATLFFAIHRSYLQNRRSHRILEEQKHEIEFQNNKITDSITYAQRIQSAVFPPVEKRKGILPDHFIMHRPCDIVSGDFYWMAKKDGRVIIAVADCTGHGVPGAFMSMLGVAFLCEIVNKKASVYANGILNQLRGRVIHALHQTGKKDEANDGMEMALCIIDFDQRKLQYSGAYRPLYIVRKNELMEIKADKMPIGIYAGRRRTFTNHEVELAQDDCIYLSTDGYADQFGGPNRKSFKSKYLKELLLKIHQKEMREQHRILETTIEEWRRDVEQIDDMLLLGIRV